MPTRKFKLPDVDDLSKGQEDVRALPVKGRHLIIGGPGTGKSVVALLRARRLTENGDNYVFLVYNHLLHQASVQLFPGEGDRNLRIETWDRWFRNLIWQATSRQCPVLERANGFKEIDWPRVRELIHGLPPNNPDNPLPHLIIDEGQDMPPQFYRALADLGFENFFVVADQNQQIEPERNSSRQDLETALCIDQSAVIELRENYRNSYPVARLARHFYPKDPASPPPDLPSPNRSAKIPVLVEYGPEGRADLKWIMDKILKMADRDPSKLHGIITADNITRTRYSDDLRTTEVRLDHPRPIIQTYAMGQDSIIRFDQGGIVVINGKACKGLEFDNVLIADIDRFRCFPGIQEIQQRLFYVMTARSKETLVMFRNKDCPCEVEVILPDDPTLLRRWS